MVSQNRAARREWRPDPPPAVPAPATATPDELAVRRMERDRAGQAVRDELRRALRLKRRRRRATKRSR